MQEFLKILKEHKKYAHFLCFFVFCFFHSYAYAQLDIFDESSSISNDTIELNTFSAGGGTTSSSIFDEIRDSSQGVVDQLDSVIDPITAKLYNDPLITLRFAVVGLEGHEQFHIVQFSVVRVLLANEDFVSAVEETSRINNMLWRAKAFMLLGHYEEKSGRRSSAISFFRQVMRFVRNEEDTQSAGRLLKELSNKFQSMGEITLASSAIKLIKEPTIRFNQMFEFIQYLTREYDNEYNDILNDLTTSIFGIIQESLQNSNTINFQVLEVMNQIAKIVSKKGGNDVANEIYDFIIARMISRADFESQLALSVAMAGKVFVGDTREVMSRVQGFPNALLRGLSLTAVARARDNSGDLFGVLPLFDLALDEAESIVDNQQKNYLYMQVALDYSRSGFFSHSLATVAKINDYDLRFNTLLEVAQAAFNREEYSEVLNMIQYMPFVGARAHMMLAVASRLRDDERNTRQVNALITNALSETNAKRIKSYLYSAMIKTLRAQLDFGSPANDDIVFDRIRNLLTEIDQPSIVVYILANIANIQAKRGNVNAGKITLERAIEINHDEEDVYKKAVSRAEVALVKLNFNDVIEAFDEASRIPTTKFDTNISFDQNGYLVSPKIKTLMKVSSSIARTGDIDLALRASREVRSSIGHVLVIAEVAIAHRELELQQKLRDGQISFVPDLSFLENKFFRPDSLQLDYDLIVQKEKIKI